MKKKVLFLGYKENQLINFLRGAKYDIVQEDKELALEEIKNINPNFIVSYGYGHIIKQDVIKEYPKIVNLHIAYLPWNRGANPNFWSWLEHTPKGYSIHYLDGGVDTGPILFQEKAKFEENETLASSYKKLKEGIEGLFIRSWGYIANGKVKARKQDREEGSFHLVKDLKPYDFLFQKGSGIKPKQSDVPAKEIEKYGKEHELWRM